MSFPDRTDDKQGTEDLIDAANAVTTRLRLTNQLCRTLEGQVASGLAAITAEQAAHATTRATLAAAQDAVKQLQAGLDTANQTIATMEGSPAVKKAREDALAKRIAQAKAQAEADQAALDALLKDDGAG